MEFPKGGLVALPMKKRVCLVEVHPPEFRVLRGEDQIVCRALNTETVLWKYIQLGWPSLACGEVILGDHIHGIEAIETGCTRNASFFPSLAFCSVGNGFPNSAAASNGLPVTCVASPQDRVFEA